MKDASRFFHQPYKVNEGSRKGGKSVSAYISSYNEDMKIKKEEKNLDDMAGRITLEN